MPSLCLFSIFDFMCWPSDKQELASYGSKELNDLVNHFSPVFTEAESINAREEWQSFKVIVNKISKNNSNRYLVYKQLLSSKPDDLKNILLLLEIMFCISPSTAACERGFSAMNRLKKPERNGLRNSTLNNLMRIAIDGPEIEKFQATAAINHWVINTKGTRHVKGHAFPKSAAQCQQDITSDSD